MIEFPETAQSEWKIVAEAAEAENRLRKKIADDTQIENRFEKLRIDHLARERLMQELAADQTPELEMITLDDYQNNPTSVPSDLIEGVLKDNGLCIFLGESGSGKSTLALQALHSLMTGDDWLGQTSKPITGGVGIMSYDMDASMVLDWMDGYPNVDARKISAVNAYRRGNPLGVPAFRQKIVTMWKHIGVEVVVIDSFSASFFGHDQNDAAATMSHYRDLKLFALTEVGAKALIVITHSTPGSPDRARGSTVHHDVADSIVAVEVGKTMERTVRMVKYRAARGQTQMNPVVVTAPDSVTHLVSLDPGAMSLAGMSLPPSVGADVFPDMPETNDEPDLDSEDESEEDDQ